MTDQIYEYKCPSCGAPLRYDSETEKLLCDYCDSSYEISVIRAMEEAAAAQTAESDPQAGLSDYQSEEWKDMALNICPSCGAEIVTDETTSVTKCPYCGNYTFIRQNLEGALRPDCVIPFKLTINDAKEALAQFTKKKKLLPKNFLNELGLEKTQGLYVPFWLYDCTAGGSISYNAHKVTTWSDSKYHYTKTDYYFVQRDGEISFSRVPSDGATKMDDTVMESIEPYDYKDLVEFNSGYLSGFIADKYDVASEDNKARVGTRIQQSVREEFAATVQGYSSSVKRGENLTVTESEVRYALLPVWVLDYKYHGMRYVYTINGQTGKVAGELPISRKRYWAWLLGIAGGVAVALWTLLLLIGGVF